MEILFVKLGALGDVINTLPLAVALKRQFNARITWLVEPLSEPLLRRHASVDAIIRFEKKRWRSQVFAVHRKLKQGRFDIVLDLQRLWKSGLFAMSAPAERRIGFDRTRCKEMTWLLPFERIAPSEPNRHMLLQYLEFAEHLGAPATRIEWGISVPDALPPGLPTRFVVLNIGATKPANRWTAEGFAELADAVSDSYGIKSVLTGGPEDAALASAIAGRAKTAPHNLVGQTRIDELTSMINAAQLVVSCDTGPMHLAVALGRPVVALFGPSNPRRTGPFYGEVIQKSMPCVPCNRSRCKTLLCMHEITSRDVMERIAKIFQRSGD